VPIPERGTPQVRPFYRQNLMHQHALEEIRAELLFFAARKRPAMHRREAELRREYKDDKFGSAAEREVLCYQDAAFSEARATVAEYDVLAEHLNTLCWRLRSQLNGAS
jgi:hypothetical protein